MQLRLSSNLTKIQEKLTITGSKSESNRVLILKKLYPNLEIKNISSSDDTKLMQRALMSKDGVIDVGHAGTTMRFLTAYFAAFTKKDILITGSERMKERPIEILVDALQSLGCQIKYEEQLGYPPLSIQKSKVYVQKTYMPANVSSQYISALMLIAPKLKHGLEIKLREKITSTPYLKMTLYILKALGIDCDFNSNHIKVGYKKNIKPFCIEVESDWSSASYLYSMVALSAVGSEMTLTTYRKDSFQGDSMVYKYYQSLGVDTVFEDNKIILKKRKVSYPENIDLDFGDTPDLAQTFVVTCLGLGLSCHISGLHTLKIKETDRLLALQQEISKLGGTIKITDNSLSLQKSPALIPNTEIETYNDHRMALSFAPLSLKTPLIINDAEVVSKSYPSYWNDLKSIGIVVEKMQ